MKSDRANPDYGDADERSFGGDEWSAGRAEAVGEVGADGTGGG